MNYEAIDRLMEDVYERFDVKICTGKVFEGDTYLQLTDVFQFQEPSTIFKKQKNENKKGCYAFKDGNIFTTREKPSETDIKKHFTTEYNIYLLMQEDDEISVLMETEGNPIKVHSIEQYKLCGIEELEKILKKQNIKLLEKSFT